MQDEIRLGPRASLSASARVDVHSEYGTLASPRVSLLVRASDAWTMRVSAGGGSFAPTPFTEETDETGLSRLAPLTGLEAERAAYRLGRSHLDARAVRESRPPLFGSVVSRMPCSSSTS